jgi:hypothetical protein
MSPRDIREVRIVFDVSDDLRVASSDPEEGGEVVPSSAPVGRAGPGHEEIPIDDRSPEARPQPPPSIPTEFLSCRGPLEFAPIWLGLYTVVRHNDTEAGARGKQLAPGTCAWEDRPVGPYEPTGILVEEPDSTSRVAAFLAHEFRLSVLANLITGSDYVVSLRVRIEGAFFRCDPESLANTQYKPFTG